MKILHVITSLSPDEGGLPEIVKNLSSEQNKSKKVSDILTTHLSKSVKYEDQTLRLNIFSFKRNFLTNICFSIGFINFLKKKIYDYDLVHIHGLYRFPTLYAAYLSKNNNIPYIISPHGSLDPYLYKQSKKNIFIKRIWEFFFEFKFLKNANAIHCTSHIEKKKILKYRFNNKIIIIPIFISNLFFIKTKLKKNFRKEIKTSSKSFNIVFIGRINFKKGLDLLIPAFKKVNLEFKNSKLIIIGPNNEKYLEDTIIPLIKKNNISKDIIFHNAIYDKKKLINCYRESDLFILPSYTENFGLSIFEAISQKIPIIVSDQIDMVKIIKKNNLGLICKCEINSIYSSIKKIIKEKKNKILLNRSFNYVYKNFSSKKIEPKFYKEYKKIIFNHKKKLIFKF